MMRASAAEGVRCFFRVSFIIFYFLLLLLLLLLLAENYPTVNKTKREVGWKLEWRMGWSWMLGAGCE
jgi:hypothetical protein